MTSDSAASTTNKAPCALPVPELGHRQGLLPLRQPGTKQETIHTYFSVVTDPQWGCWNFGISELVKERNQWILHQKWITFRGGLHFEIHD